MSNTKSSVTNLNGSKGDSGRSSKSFSEPSMQNSGENSNEGKTPSTNWNEPSNLRGDQPNPIEPFETDSYLNYDEAAEERDF